MNELIVWLYPWLKVGHIISIITWMAGLFYLPRLFVYHSEEIDEGSKGDKLFIKMEKRLLNIIMFPAMISSWIFGLFLYSIPGLVDWGLLWPWVKLLCVIFMTAFHLWLFKRQIDFEKGKNTVKGRTFRLMNEVPTILLFIIIIMVIVRPI
ncbi:MAG: CopD family protein [Planktomarina sp.]|nr:CopD family protein [Planktomarina sp.]